MGPIINAVLRHADRHPTRLAMRCHEACFSYADLVREITTRMQAFVTDQADTLTVEGGAEMPDKVLDALARLGMGFSIVGATSGSMGPAKSYVRTQASWITSFLLEQECFGVSADDVVLAHGNPSHSLFFYAICNALYAGASVLCAKGFRPDDLYAQAAELRATVLYAVPTQLEMLVKHRQQTTVPTVRLVLSSGARFAAHNIDSIRKIFPNAAIIDFYGASETSYIALASHTSDRRCPAGSVGKAFPGVTIYIEPLQGFTEDQPAAHGAQAEIGRIWAHSDMLFERYLGVPPAAYEERIDQSGRRWLTVGDLGWINDDGYLFLAGRTDRTINVSAVKIQPEEIEAALMGHLAVMQAAVVGLPDGLRGERLVAALQLKSPVLAAELIAYLRPRLGDQKVPRDYRLLSQWPMTPSGKTDLAAVRRLMLAADTERL